MAVAARPGPSDARVPCPLCGGLIHPIAGKCKHCKADLTSYHAARPAANAPLPALHPAAVANGHAHGRAGTHPAHHAAHAPAGHAAPGPAALAYDASQPVLPPRPTGQSYAAEPRASGLRSWPVLVIILATVAIVVAVVLMVWPSNRQDPGGKRTIAPPPAPERMQTEPEIKTAPPRPQAPDRLTPAPAPAPPSGQSGATPDPWSENQVAPPPPNPGAGRPDPDTDTSSNDASGKDDDDDLDTLNPFDPRQAPTAPGRHRLQLNGRGTVMFTVMEHLCRKMLACNAGDPMARSTCDALARQAPPPPASCPAANRCVHLIDAMSCGSQTDSFAQLSLLMSQLHDCSDAIQC